MSLINESNESFTDDDIEKVWRKARTSFGFDPDFYRFDENNALIKYSEYGNSESTFGWQISHIRPLIKGGTNDLYNLHALHWENHLSQGDRFPQKNYKICYDFFTKKNIKL